MPQRKNALLQNCNRAFDFYPDRLPAAHIPLHRRRLWSAHNSYIKIIDKVSIGAMEKIAAS